MLHLRLLYLVLLLVLAQLALIACKDQQLALFVPLEHSEHYQEVLLQQGQLVARIAAQEVIAPLRGK